MCPGCSNRDWKAREGFVCAECGYRFIDVKKDTNPFKLYFCDECGVTYSDGKCTSHGSK